MNPHITEAVGITERIVILYANHSGRESDNRGQFRKEVQEIVEKALTKAYEQGKVDGVKGEREQIVFEADLMIRRGLSTGGHPMTDEYSKGWNESRQNSYKCFVSVMREFIEWVGRRGAKELTD